MIIESMYEDHSLEVHLYGDMCARRTNDVIFELNSQYEHLYEEQHTKLISFIDCNDDENTLSKAMEKISTHISTERCAAIAIVVSEELVNTFMKIPCLLNNAHNGIRLFIDMDIAKSWISIQKNTYRKMSLH